MNKIKNVSNSAITINLPNVRYRTELRPKQERPLPDDVFMEFKIRPKCSKNEFPLFIPINASLAKLYDEEHFKYPSIIVDTNHSNSGKQYEEQVRIAKEVLHSTRHNPQIRKMVKGLMIESYIEDGCQKVNENVYGKSITDPCLGWEKTEKLILDLAELRKIK